MVSLKTIMSALALCSLLTMVTMMRVENIFLSTSSSSLSPSPARLHLERGTRVARGDRNVSKDLIVNKPYVARKTRKPGRDGVDHSHVGLAPDPIDGMFHAWDAEHKSTTECFGARPFPSCIDQTSVDWFRDNVLLAVVTGAEGAFRVEVSQCTWLSHFPPENVFVFSDLVPHRGLNRTPHAWVQGTLPPSVIERDGDIFSEHVKEGYLKIVRRRGQGYSASWIVAQFRFAQALEHLDRVRAERAQHPSKTQFKWFMVADDDTIVHLPNLVKRLRQIDTSKEYYLSRKGWGGAGHLYTVTALAKMMAVLPKCVDKYFVRGFRASDDMLLKCASVAHLFVQKEDTMSHCPASHLGKANLLSESQATFHGKKDFYPPLLLTTWRVSLYYYASYCKDDRAAELAVYYSACAFGSCKQQGCTKEKNDEMIARWRTLSRDNNITLLPFAAEKVGVFQVPDV